MWLNVGKWANRFSRRRVASSENCDCNAMVVGSIHRFLSLWHKGKKSPTMSSVTQHAMPRDSADGGERRVLILGSLCLPCCKRIAA